MPSSLLFADRSERGKLRLSGEQRAWFLHQILTQSFEDIAPGEARDAAFVTAHGRMKAFMETVATEDALLMHFEPELREVLAEEIRRYVFATRVEIEDVSDDLALLVVAGEGWRVAAASLDGVLALHPTRSLGGEAGYAWLDRSALASAAATIREAGGVEASEEELEAIRIHHRVPRWGREMNETSFPQEVGIDETAVHYAKGCYLGQEAMAKIHFRGKPNKRLALITSSEPLAPGAELLLGETKVGSVTSVTGSTALALVRHTVGSGTTVDAGGVVATVAS
jgi:tRNA-modifying protein YgfZ